MTKRKETPSQEEPTMPPEEEITETTAPEQETNETAPLVQEENETVTSPEREVVEVASTEPTTLPEKKPVETAPRKPNVLRLPVQVTRGVDPYTALVDALKKAEYGVFLVTVHAGQVVKYARVEPAVKVQAAANEDQQTVLG